MLRACRSTIRCFSISPLRSPQVQLLLGLNSITRGLILARKWHNTPFCSVYNLTHLLFLFWGAQLYICSMGILQTAQDASVMIQLDPGRYKGRNPLQDLSVETSTWHTEVWFSIKISFFFSGLVVRALAQDMSHLDSMAALNLRGFELISPLLAWGSSVLSVGGTALIKLSFVQGLLADKPTLLLLHLHHSSPCNSAATAASPCCPGEAPQLCRPYKMALQAKFRPQALGYQLCHSRLS